MQSLRSSTARSLATLAAALALGASFASNAADYKAQESGACKAARLSAWFEHQRQLDVDNNPFFVLPTPKECKADGARSADNRDSTEAQVVASQAATQSQPATEVR